MNVSYLNTYALIFLNFALVVYTAFLWIESRKTRIQNSIPQISLIFYPITGRYIGMRILNNGKSDAVDVKITCLNSNEYISKNKKYTYSEHLSKIYSYVPVNQEYSYTVGYYQVVKKELFSFEISFSDISKKHKIKQIFSIDMNQLKGSLIEKANEKIIANSIKGINESLSKIITNGIDTGLRVYTFPPEYCEIKSLTQELDMIRWQLDEMNAERRKQHNKD